jgi:hypothetical protein
MHDLSTLVVFLVLWILLFALCRRMLVASVGATVVRRLERVFDRVRRAGLWLLALPFVLAWRFARLHFRRGRPMLRVHSARVMNPPPPLRPRRTDRDLFLPRRRRRS